MKRSKIFIYSLAVVAICSLLACTKDVPQVATTDRDFSNSATVQVFSATVKAARNYIYVDTVPVSGIAMGYGSIFPATAFGFRVTAGTHTILIKDTLPATTQVPISFSQALAAGNSYTVFTYDTITSIKQLTVLNAIMVPTDTSSMLRFANFVYNTTALPNVDVYSYRKGTATPVFTNVAAAQVTNFIPYPSGITDTLYVYATGTTAPLIVKQLVTSLTPTRSYTSVYSGSYKGTKAIPTFATY